MAIGGARHSVNCLRAQEEAALRLQRIESTSLAGGLPVPPRDYQIFFMEFVVAAISPSGQPVKDRTFDPSRIAALIDKAKETQAFVLPEPVNQTTRISNQLTMSQIDAIRFQIQQCWSVPAGARDAENLIIRIQFSLDREGRVLGQPRIVDQSRMGDGFYRERRKAPGAPYYNAPDQRTPTSELRAVARHRANFQSKGIVGRDENGSRARPNSTMAPSCPLWHYSPSFVAALSLNSEPSRM